METLVEAAKIIQQGGVILYPTDTIWGLGCDPTSEQAVERILEIKKRAPNKSFVLLAASIPMIERYVDEIPTICYDLMELSTEPLTLVLSGARGLVKQVVAVDGTVAIRLTSDPFCKALINKVGKPIVSTSANISGQHFPLNFEQIDAGIKDKVDYIIHNPDFVNGKKPSKIMKVEKNGRFQLIRS